MTEPMEMLLRVNNQISNNCFSPMQHC